MELYGQTAELGHRRLASKEPPLRHACKPSYPRPRAKQLVQLAAALQVQPARRMLTACYCGGRSLPCSSGARFCLLQSAYVQPAHWPCVPAYPEMEAGAQALIQSQLPRLLRCQAEMLTSPQLGTAQASRGQPAGWAGLGWAKLEHKPARPCHTPCKLARQHQAAQAPAAWLRAALG
jgi:hypothetical protein